MMRFKRGALLVGLTILLAGCGGGGGGPGDADQSTPVDLVVPAAEPTGPVDNSTLGNWDNTLLGVGEFGPATQFMNNWRGILTFNIAQIPSGATIVEAELVAVQFQVNGQPYFNLGSVFVDHIEMGPTMQGSAYDGLTVGGAAGMNVGTLSSNGTIGTKNLDVTGVVQRDVDAGTGMTQLRLRFQVANSGDDEIDNVFFAGPESNDNAILRIRYVE